MKVLNRFIPAFDSLFTQDHKIPEKKRKKQNQLLSISVHYTYIHKSSTASCYKNPFNVIKIS